MARLPRVTQPIFAGSATNNGVFGSAQASGGTLSNVLATIMGLSAWSQGWLSAIIGGSKFPPLEEFQAVEYVHSSQIAYLLQQGISEYDAGTTYFLDNICVNPGTFQLYGSITDNNIGNPLTDAAHWQPLLNLANGNGRTVLKANANYYVATTGNDSTGTGAVGAPWLTIQHAINYLQSSVDLGGFIANINVADGTYTGTVIVNAPFTGGGSVQLIGDVATPTNCIISTAGNTCIQLNNAAQLYVKGFTLQGGACASAGTYSQLYFNGAMVFGAAATGAHMGIGYGGSVTISANYTISGNSAVHWYVGPNGNISVNAGVTITLTGTPSFSTAFAETTECGTMSVSGITFSGSATGQRYYANANSVIYTGGAGASYLPGNSAGSTATGGQYV